MVKFTSVKYFSAILLSTILFSVSAHAQRVQSDFDADGISDSVIVSESEGGLSWGAKLSSDSSSSLLGTVGQLGDEVAMADWLGTGKPQIGVVYGNSFTGLMEWVIKDADGNELSENFGDADAIAISGGDYNGDGVADAAVAHASGGKLRWSVQPSLFNDNAPAATEFVLGRKGEKPFFLNVDGTQDWAAVFRRSGRQAYLLRLRNVVTGEKRIVRGTGSVGNGRVSPVPLAGGSGTDKVMFASTDGTSTSIVIVDLAGNLTSATIQASGDVVVGDFLVAAGEEIAVYGDDAVYIYSPETSQVTQIDAVDGIAVDEVNINAVESRDSDSNDGGGETPDGDLATVCASYTPIISGQMLIKSEISKHINPGDVRATGYTLVCGSQCVKNLNKADFFYADGSYAGSVGYYGRFSGNGQPRLYGAAGGAPQHFASQIARKADGIGNGKLYMQTSRAKSGSTTTCKEFNPRGRNGGV